MNRRLAVALGLALIAPLVQAQQMLKPDTARIAVFGEAETQVQPDQAVLRLGFETTDADISAARKEGRDILHRLVETVRKQGVDEDDIRTEQFSIWPRYNKKSDIKRYTARGQIRVKVREVDKVGPLLAGAMDTGATQVQGVQFESSRKKAHEAEIRDEAIRNARSKAERMAKALGQGIGPAILIDETGQDGMPRAGMAYARVAQMEADGGDSIPTGTIEIRSRVKVVFELLAE